MTIEEWFAKQVASAVKSEKARTSIAEDFAVVVDGLTRVDVDGARVAVRFESNNGIELGYDANDRLVSVEFTVHIVPTFEVE